MNEREPDSVQLWNCPTQAKSRLEWATRPTGTEEFIHVFDNLYLVLTPLAGKPQSIIEDCFSQQTKDVVINNKSFSPANDYDTDTQYGKATFSQYVEKHAGSLDFGGFAEILTRISAVIEAHKNVYAAKSAAAAD